MKFFSGFCFDGESELFSDYIRKDEFCVAGFSFGAIKAFEYLFSSTQRVDTIQLFSPAFFQDRDSRFKRIQTINFQKNRQRYIDNFLNQVCYPSSMDIRRYFHDGSLEELKELLEYTWDKKKIQSVVDRGVDIEVYLGGLDKIIDSNFVSKFFMPYANVYFIKGAGHLLV